MPRVCNLFHIADWFQPGIILQTGPQRNDEWHMQIYFMLVIIALIQ